MSDRGRLVELPADERDHQSVVMQQIRAAIHHSSFGIGVEAGASTDETIVIHARGRRYELSIRQVR